MRNADVVRVVGVRRAVSIHLHLRGESDRVGARVSEYLYLADFLVRNAISLVSVQLATAAVERHPNQKQKIPLKTLDTLVCS